MVLWKRRNEESSGPAPSDVRPAATAQELFNEMVKERVWPQLRTLGFRGSGLTFRWPADDAWVMIGLQKSSGNTRDYVKFTANVSVTTKAEWGRQRADSSFLGDKPSPNAHPWGWGARIGQLMPAQQDHWWVLRTGDEWEPVAGELLDAIQSFALPRMLSVLEAKRA